MKNSFIDIPPYALEAISRLESRGFEAYLAGGCVRDSLMGRTPHDWDIASSAKPGEVTACFDGYSVIPTGIKHGTVSVILNGGAVEITTFRVDGAYSDGRRPDSVSFTAGLREDLSRRDFTVNALAYHPQKGVTDVFGGIQDIKDEIIRCVGAPEKRFAEDALRILRGARFACELGFSIEKNTLDAIISMRERLNYVSEERIASELNRAVISPGFGRVFGEVPELLYAVIPEMELYAGTKTELARILRSMDLADSILPVRLALLFGHAEMSESIMKRLKYDNAAISRVAELLKRREDDIRPELICLRRLLSLMGEEAARQLIALHVADKLAGDPGRAEETRAEIMEINRVLTGIIAEGLCYRVKDLAINGNDLMAAGIQRGPWVGSTLSSLLDMVITGGLENEKAALLKAAMEINAKVC